MSVKQVIVIRSDLRNKDGFKVRTGKLMVQFGHASMAFLAKRVRQENLASDWIVYNVTDLDEVQALWLKGHMTKACVKVDSLEELLEIDRKAQEAGLECHLITDLGKTEFAEPTVTCLAIGPDDAAKIDAITGHLSLL